MKRIKVERCGIGLGTTTNLIVVGGGVEGHASTLGARGRLVTRREPVSISAPPPKSPYDSKWEAAYANKLELEKHAGLIKAYKYEGISLQLSKGQYHRPDFIVWHLDNSIEMAQVKGWHKNMRAGIKGLKWAAQLHPWFTWTVKRWTGTGWDSNYVEI